MKILIPVGDFIASGGCRVLSELANSWVRSNHQVCFLAPSTSRPPSFPTIASILWVDGNGDIVDARSDGVLRGVKRLTSLYKALNCIGKNYDIVLANFSLTAYPVAFSHCGSAYKFYYIQAYEPEYFWYKKTLKALAIGLLSKCSYYLPINRIVNAPLYFRYKNIRSNMYVPPGLDLEIFNYHNKPAKELRDAETITIGCIGRSEPEKGTKYVLNAFEVLYKQDHRYVLKVAYGNLPNNWSHERCEVVTPKNDRELAEFYKSLDILIAPGTVQHGAPHYPVLEAMACGIPVVTTGYYGADNSTAWIVENKSSSSIVSAVSTITNDSELTCQKSLKALQFAQQLDWEIISAKMMQCFNEFKKNI